VAQAERRLRRAKVIEGVVSGRRFGLLDLSVSPDSLDRGLRIRRWNALMDPRRSSLDVRLGAPRPLSASGVAKCVTRRTRPRTGSRSPRAEGSAPRCSTRQRDSKDRPRAAFRAPVLDRGG
jgi:hypothetical protein